MQAYDTHSSLTPRQAAHYLGISEAALRLWRSRCEGPRFFKAGHKLIRYRRTDLDSWIESRLSEPGTSPVKAKQVSTQITAQQ
jgi:predicted DNA-binding transcriptional regulator AlpA